MTEFSLTKRTLWLTAIIIIGATFFNPVYDGFRFMAYVGLAGVCSAGVELALTRWQVDAVFRLPAQLLAVVLMGQAALFWSQSLLGLPTPASITAFAHAAVGGWTELLTTSLTAPATGALLIPPFLLTWISVAVCARTARSRTVWSHLLGVAIIIIGAMVFWPSDHRVFVVGAAAVFVGGLAYLARSAVTAGERPEGVGRPGEHRSEAAKRSPSVTAGAPLEGVARLRRWSVMAVPLLVVGLVLMGAAPPVLGHRGTNRSTLRRLAQPAFDVAALGSPLSEFKAHLAPPVANAVVADVVMHSAGPTPTRWRLATLDTYDGRIWSVGRQGSQAGVYEDVRSASSQARLAGSGDAEINVRALSGSWLPIGGANAGVVGKGTLARRAKINFTSGAVVVPGGVQNGDRYTIRYQELPRPTVGELTVTPVDPGAAVGDAVELPVAMRTLNESLVAGKQTDYARIAAIADYFRTTGFVDGDAVPGHSLGRLTGVASGSDAPVGSGEQFAAAAAALVRSLGIPVRVGVGFVPTIDPGVRTVILRNHDIAAWIEVKFEKYGWVVFDVTPPADRRPTQRTVKRLEQPTLGAADVEPGPSVEQSDERLAPKPKPVQSAPKSKLPLVSSTTWKLLGGFALGVMALLGYVGLVRAARAAKRRRRRNHTDPSRRVAGAFDEVLDLHQEFGWRPTPSSSIRQIVRDLGPQPNSEAMRRLGAATERAAFHDGAPTEELVDSSWADADRIMRDLRLTASRAERVRSMVNPQVLVGAVRRD